MKTKLKIAPGAILYLAYFTYIFYRVLNTSMYAVEHGRVVHLLDRATELLALCCVVIFLLYKKRYKVQEFLFLGAFMGILVLVYFRTGYQNVVTITLLFMCGYRTNFRDIVKVSLFALLFSLAFVLLSWRVGIISDLVYSHQMVNGTALAHTYGFSFYTYPPYILLAASMEWVYLRGEKTSWAELAVIAGIAYVVYQVFSSRASFLMTLLFVFLYVLIIKLHALKQNSRIMKCMAYFGFFAIFVFTILLVTLYANGNSFVIQLNELVSGRFQYLSRAFSQYGVSLFGQNITMVGAYDELIEGVDRYNYIDGGYMYSLFCYGLAYTVILLLCYTIVFVSAAKKNDYMLCVWLLTFMIMNMTNNMFTALQYNPILFLLPGCLAQMRGRWTIRRISIKRRHPIIKIKKRIAIPFKRRRGKSRAERIV